MGDRSAIEWTSATWNPIRGCSRVSEGCRNCYAERQAARQQRGAYAGLVKSTLSGPRWTGKVRFVHDALDVPIHWKKPRRISMSDLFHEKVEAGWLIAIFDVMRRARWHTFQVLTKRPEIMRDYVSASQHGGYGPPLPNVHLGVSVEDRSTLWRLDVLRQVPAALHWCSFAPLLEDLGTVNLDGIGWAVWGGESGPGARSCDLSWVRRGLKQCHQQSVAAFVKQLGADPYDTENHWITRGDGVVVPVLNGLSIRERLRDPKGGDMAQWPEDLRIRGFPR
jgi:protein gp37